MKNIHILPTDKPSRLHLVGYNLTITSEYKNSACDAEVNIYITSNEEVKEGDFVVQINFEKTNTQVIKCETEFQTKIANSKDGSFSKNKIILTTDQDLIKNGVQSIDDEFLEWFVKNQSCEWVEVNSIETNPDYKSNWENRFTYKIIIPKEEPKKETLEEAAESYSKRSSASVFQENHKKDFIAGAKWQQERMYSEEDLKRAFINGVNNVAWTSIGLHFFMKEDKWFEKFKQEIEKL